MGFFGKPKQPQTVTCMDVVDAYGAAIERLAATGRQMHSVTELPFEKPLIEVALLTLALRGNTSAPESVLTAGYIELATFREGEPAVSVALSGPPPATREEIAAFMKETAPKVAAQGSELEVIAKESARRSQEWDERLASPRRAAHA